MPRFIMAIPALVLCFPSVQPSYGADKAAGPYRVAVAAVLCDLMDGDRAVASIAEGQVIEAGTAVEDRLQVRAAGRTGWVRRGDVRPAKVEDILRAYRLAARRLRNYASALVAGDFSVAEVALRGYTQDMRSLADAMDDSSLARLECDDPKRQEIALSLRRDLACSLRLLAELQSSQTMYADARATRHQYVEVKNRLPGGFSDKERQPLDQTEFKPTQCALAARDLRLRDHDRVVVTVPKGTVLFIERLDGKNLRVDANFQSGVVSPDDVVAVDVGHTDAMQSAAEAYVRTASQCIKDGRYERACDALLRCGYVQFATLAWFERLYPRLKGEIVERRRAKRKAFEEGVLDDLRESAVFLGEKPLTQLREAILAATAAPPALLDIQAGDAIVAKLDVELQATSSSKKHTVRNGQAVRVLQAAGDSVLVEGGGVSGRCAKNAFRFPTLADLDAMYNRLSSMGPQWDTMVKSIGQSMALGERRKDVVLKRVMELVEAAGRDGDVLEQYDLCADYERFEGMMYVGMVGCRSSFLDICREMARVCSMLDQNEVGKNLMSRYSAIWVNVPGASFWNAGTSVEPERLRENHLVIADKPLKVYEDQNLVASVPAGRVLRVIDASGPRIRVLASGKVGFVADAGLRRAGLSDAVEYLFKAKRATPPKGDMSDQALIERLEQYAVDIQMMLMFHEEMLKGDSTEAKALRKNYRECAEMLVKLYESRAQWEAARTMALAISAVNADRKLGGMTAHEASDFAAGSYAVLAREAEVRNGWSTLATLPQGALIPIVDTSDERLWTTVKNQRGWIAREKATATTLSDIKRLSSHCQDTLSGIADLLKAGKVAEGIVKAEEIATVARSLVNCINRDFREQQSLLVLSRKTLAVILQLQANLYEVKHDKEAMQATLAELRALEGGGEKPPVKSLPANAPPAKMHRGDFVVTAGMTPVKKDEKVVATVSKGRLLAVQEVSGDRLAVTADDADGWIEQTNATKVTDEEIMRSMLATRDTCQKKIQDALKRGDSAATITAAQDMELTSENMLLFVKTRMPDNKELLKNLVRAHIKLLESISQFQSVSGDKSAADVTEKKRQRRRKELEQIGK